MKPSLLASDADLDSLLPLLLDERERRWVRDVGDMGREMERQDRTIALMKAMLTQAGDRREDLRMLTELAAALEERVRWQQAIIRSLSGNGEKHGG